jgi:hypothetical protein
MKRTFLIVGLAILAGIADNFSDNPDTSPADRPHVCRWHSCPYKGTTPGTAAAAVEKYTQAPEGSDGYCIDMLHLQYPEKDSDQLEDILFSKTDNLFEY